MADLVSGTSEQCNQWDYPYGIVTVPVLGFLLAGLTDEECQPDETASAFLFHKLVSGTAEQCQQFEDAHAFLPTTLLVSGSFSTCQQFEDARRKRFSISGTSEQCQQFEAAVGQIPVIYTTLVSGTLEITNNADYAYAFRVIQPSGTFSQCQQFEQANAVLINVLVSGTLEIMNNTGYASGVIGTNWDSYTDRDPVVQVESASGKVYRLLVAHSNETASQQET